MLIDLFKSLRPEQWLKNLAIFAPAFFAGQAANSASWDKLVWAFVILSAASSGSYLINDLIDREADRLHPLKRERPIAAGRVPEWLAALLAVFLLTGSFGLSMQLPIYFTLTVLAFILLQLSYNFYFKSVILLDVMVIAASFSLRVFAGAFAILVPLSAWLILTTISLSLFLAVGKRRGEVTLLSHSTAAKHRAVVSHYPTLLLDGLTFTMAATTLSAYSLFTFNQPEFTTRHRIAELLPQTLANPKWLMVTIPIVIYGIFRYLYVIYEKREGASPERVLGSDRPLLSAVVLWIIASYAALYIVGK